MTKKELKAIIEAQAAEIAALRRRVEALEARPIVNGVTVTREVPAPRPVHEPCVTPPGTATPRPWWDDGHIWCDTRTYTAMAGRAREGE